MVRTMIVTLVAAAVHAATIEVRDADIQPGQTVVWTAGNTYLMKEKIFVEAGAVLRIQPGVVVKAEPLIGSEAVALVICRGGRIYAEGTPEAPIIMTCKADDLLPPGQTVLEYRTTTGQWGGIVLLGKARTNQSGGQALIEGISANEERGMYGGSDDSDTSGVLRYVSIRYPGMEIMPDVELNGLTMGAVGAGTVIEYVEVFNSSDDAFEWFGGSVNTRYLLAVNPQDDAFDYDVGFRGRGQFWCCLHGRPGQDSRAGEHDGALAPIDAQPFSIPVISNATYVQLNDYTATLMFRDNAGGKYLNSIFHDGGDIFIRSQAATDSDDRYYAGDLALVRNIFWGKAKPRHWGFYDPYNGIVTIALRSGQNVMANPGFKQAFPSDNISGPTGRLDMRPCSSVVVSNLVRVAEYDTSGFLEQVCFKGAFDPTKPMWIRGWTATDWYGWLDRNDTPAMAELPLCDQTGAARCGRAPATDATPALLVRGGRLVLNTPAGMRWTVDFHGLNGRFLGSIEIVGGSSAPGASIPVLPPGAWSGPIFARIRGVAGPALLCRLP